MQASTTTLDITPRTPAALYGYPHVERISTGVHDPLLATVILLRDRYHTVVLASLDLLMIEPPYARELRNAVARAADTDECCVFISCTHTHSGPVTSSLIGWQDDPAVPAPDPEYLAFVKQKLVAAATRAAAETVPAELAWTTADATGVGGNRISSEGATDPECGILAVRDKQRRPLAAALVYGMHPTVLHEDSTLFSADFPYYTRRHIQEHLEQDIPIAYHTAPCGNQSPRHYVNGQTFAEAERLGRRLGNAVCKSLDSLQSDDWQHAPHLEGALADVELPRTAIPTLPEAEKLLADYRDKYERLQKEHAPKADVRTAECAVFGAEGALALARAEKNGEINAKLRAYAPLQVQALRIGDAVLAGLPGECFTEYALEIKRRAPRRTFVVSLVNGDLQGYIVTPEAAKQGGYEAANAIFAPESGKILVDAALKLIMKVYEQ